MHLKQAIGLRIKALRRSKEMSQEMLAEKTGISSKYLSSIERGKENPTLDTFINLSEALEVEISEIFNLTHEGKPVKELKSSLTAMIKGSDEERLRLTAKILKAIYL